jgi:hypothetical protein
MNRRTLLTGIAAVGAAQAVPSIPLASILVPTDDAIAAIDKIVASIIMRMYPPGEWSLMRIPSWPPWYRGGRPLPVLVRTRPNGQNEVIQLELLELHLRQQLERARELFG